jgi:hypothetical protein
MISMYFWMLKLGATPLQSGRFVHQCEISDDSIVVVVLPQSGREWESVFRKNDELKKLIWKWYGIKYDKREPDKSKFKI